jgi:hypothetical protein
MSKLAAPRWWFLPGGRRQFEHPTERSPQSQKLRRDQSTAFTNSFAVAVNDRRPNYEILLAGLR